MNSEPQFFWTTGVITTYYTALPETEHMKAEDISVNCTEKAAKVYIDGRPHKSEQVLMQDGVCGLLITQISKKMDR
eukprot:11736343-Heterocapsa_arctica.AAC.1